MRWTLSAATLGKMFESVEFADAATASQSSCNRELSVRLVRYDIDFPITIFGENKVLLVIEYEWRDKTGTLLQKFETATTGISKMTRKEILEALWSLRHMAICNGRPPGCHEPCVDKATDIIKRLEAGEEIEAEDA